MYNKEDLAYYAGFFDGEGCIMINKTARALEIRVTQTSYGVLLDLKQKFGGAVYDSTKTKAHHKVKWQWVVWGKKAAAFISYIYPYLRIKDKEAQLAMEYQEGKNQKYSSRNILLGSGVDAIEEAQRLVMRKLKHNVSKQG